MAVLITRQPQSACVAPNSVATFTLTCQGDIASYDWQYSTDLETWIDIGLNSPTLTLMNVQIENSKSFYRCKILDSTDDTYVYSASVELFVFSESFISKVIKGGDMFLAMADVYTSLRQQTSSDLSGVITDIQAALNQKASADHDHDTRYYTQTQSDNKYLTDLSINDKTITLTYGDGDTDTITTQDYRVKADKRSGTLSNVYLTGTTSSSDSNTSSLVKDAGVYLTTTAGQLKAEGGFVGNLTGNVTGDLTGNVTGNADTATTATKLDTNAGSATQPVYFSGGKPVATTYSLNKTVPSDAVFTDTTYSVVSTSANGLAPKVTDTSKFLKGDGTWATPTNDSVSNTVLADDAAKTVYLTGTQTSTTATGKQNFNTKIYFNNTTLTAPTFSGNLTGNADTASKLYSAVNITVGGQTKSFDGSTAITFDLATIGAQAAGSYAAESHTHNYAGSSSAGGAATSANKINTDAGSATQPVYFSGGVPVATKYALNKTVPANAAFTDTNNAVTNNVLADNAAKTVYLTGTQTSTTATGGQYFNTKIYFNNTTLTAPTFSGALSGKATSAGKLQNGSTDYAVGSATQPAYFSGGVPVATTYTLEKSVPSDAVFTDTVYTHPTSGVTAGTYRSVTVNSGGHVTAGSNPTTISGYGITDAYTKTQVDNKIADLVNSAPEALDTLKELADALGNDANFSTTVATQIGNKVDKSAGITGLSVSGKTITYTRGDNTTGTITTQDTTYSVVSTSANGLAPKVTDTSKFLKGDGTWATPIGTTYSAGNGLSLSDTTFSASYGGNGSATTVSRSDHTHNYAGSSSAGGAATSANKINTDAGSATQPVYFSGGVPVATTYELKLMQGATSSAAGVEGLVPPATAANYKKFLRGDGTWQTPTNTDTKVTNTKLADDDTTTKAFITGTTATATATGTQVFDGDIYFQNDTLTAPTFSGNLTGNVTGNADTATTATKLGTADKGSATQGIYLDDGVPKAMTYSLNKTVPSDAVFTDTNVKSTEAATTKGYLLATSTAGTTTGAAIKDPGVYLTTTSGTLHATRFAGTADELAGLTVGKASPSTDGLDMYTTNNVQAIGNALLATDDRLYDHTVGAMVMGTFYSDQYNARRRFVMLGDYWTGQLSIRGCVDVDTDNDGWQTWRRVLDNQNYASYITPAGIGASATGHTHNYAGSSSAGGAATSLDGFAISSTTNFDIDRTDTVQGIGYVNELTAADWNYNQPSGALFLQSYSDKYRYEIFGDYRTGQMSIRGKKGGTWQSWRNVLDSSNYASYITPGGIGAATSSHTHNYAGSSSAGGSATSAVKLDTSSAGSATQPVYFTGGKPEATTYSLNKTVPSDAVFTDTKVTNTLNTTTKAYITGTTSSSTNTGTQIFDTGVYLGTTAGSLITDSLAVTNNITSSQASTTYIQANNGKVVINSNTTAGVFNGLWRYPSSNGAMILYGYSGNIGVAYTDQATIDAGTNKTTKAATLFNESGNAAWPGTVTATNGFVGNLTGNVTGNADTATTATKVGTSTVGSSTKPVYIKSGAPTATTYYLRPLTGATAETAGSYGFAPSPQAGDNEKFLKGDGTWSTPTDTTYSAGNGLSLSDTTFSVSYGGNGSATTVSRSDHTHNYAGSSSAGGAASSLAGFVTTTTADMQINRTDVVQGIGYVKSLTAADWNYNQTYGALILQSYSDKWRYEIFGDYHTGQMSIRGKKEGTWQSWRNVLDSSNYSNYITPAGIGAAAASHGTHVTFSDTNPLVAGTAAVGTATTVARSDHVHPAQTTVTGNAGSATKLKTARNIVIGNKTNSFNGTGNITYTLADIGAAPDTEFTGATANAAGTKGLVPAPAAGTQTNYYLCADGTWKQVSVDLTAAHQTSGTVGTGYYHRNIAYGTSATPTTDATYGGSGSIYIYYT